MRFPFLLLILFFVFPATGQTGENSFPELITGDSLYSAGNYKAALEFYKGELNSNQPQNDTMLRAEIYRRLSLSAEKLELYTEAISWHLEMRKLKPLPHQIENTQYLDKVTQLLPKATDSLGLTRLYYRYGLLLSHEGEPARALSYYLISLELAKAIGYSLAVSTIANDVAGEYYDAGLFDSSINMYQQSLQAAIAANDTHRMSAVYVNLAGCYIEKGDFKSGIQLHLDALRLKESISDSSNLSYYYLQTAIVYHKARNFENWETYVMKANSIRNCEVCTPPREKAMLYAELGGIAKYKNQDQQAIQYYDTLLSLSTEIGYLNGQKAACDNLALIYKDMGNHGKALELIKQAERFLTDNPFQVISHNNIKAGLLQQMGKQKEALVLLNQNIQNPNLLNYASEKLDAFRLLYEINLQLLNYKEAFRWNDSARALENLLRDTDVRKEMARLEAKYQTEKKEQQINLLTAENKISNQRMRLSWLFIGFLFLLIALVLALLFFRRKQAEFKQSELQQQLLLSQMNPHFIFNVMGSIQGYLYKNDSLKAADYLSRFASLSRSVLENSSQERISLKEEIEMLQNYIELERAGKENPFEVIFIIDPEMETEFIEIPPMLLQPFVENAIKHGLRDLDYPGKLILSFVEKPDSIAVEIVDNGRGLTGTPASGHQSKALEIFRQRKKVIERRCKKELSFEFQNLHDHDTTKQGVRVFLQIPILNND
ncbi:MAG: histidine kinase [Bacteroidales bacterium]|nr:histidine kinase [Bacteroidales bacterium]